MHSFSSRSQHTVKHLQIKQKLKQENSRNSLFSLQKIGRRKYPIKLKETIESRKTRFRPKTKKQKP